MSRPTKGFALVAVVVVVGVIVAAAAEGVQLITVPVALGEARLWLRVLGAALIAGGIRALMMQKRALLAEGFRHGNPMAIGVRTAAMIMGFVAFMALTNPPPPTPGSGARPGFNLGGSSPFGLDGLRGELLDARTRGSDPIIRGNPDFDMEIAQLEGITVEASDGILDKLGGLLPQLLFIVLVIGVMRYLARTMKHHERELAFNIMLDPAEAAAGLEASLEHVYECGPDLRGRITRAYVTLLEALTAAGAPREAYEAPHEHLFRTLGPLGVRPEPLHRLAELYVLAHFSRSEILEEHRAAAAEALEASLADLAAYAPPLDEEAELTGSVAP